MRKLPLTQVLRRGIRATVCVQCYQRPVGSEALSPDTPRDCEPDCPIFDNLARLKVIADRDDLGPFETTIRNRICQKCEQSPTAGDYCAEGLTRSCPLSRYAGLVLEVLGRIRS
jgi:hypothetical protein